MFPWKNLGSLSLILINTSIPAWIRNYINCYVWDEITSPFPNFIINIFWCSLERSSDNWPEKYLLLVVYEQQIRICIVLKIAWKREELLENWVLSFSDRGYHNENERTFWCNQTKPNQTKLNSQGNALHIYKISLYNSTISQHCWPMFL